MRRFLGVAVLAAAALLASCSDSKKDSSISTVTFAGSSSSARSSSPTTLAASTTVGATTTTSTAAATTTSTLPVTTPVQRGSVTSVLADEPGGPTTTLDRSPRADDAEILATYAAAWTGFAWTAAHPDDPQWDWLQSTVAPDFRGPLRSVIEARWSNGFVLNTDGGLVTNAHVFNRDQQFVTLFDCRTTGIYWMDKATGQAAEGQATGSRLEGWYVTMARDGGKWRMLSADVDTVARRVAECGA